MQEPQIQTEDEVISIYERKLKDCKINTIKKWAIYGTGNGAEIVYAILKRWKCLEILECVVDNDDVANKGKRFHDYVVEDLAHACTKIDGIVIASMDYHEIVTSRVKAYLECNQISNIDVVNLFAHNTTEEICEYVRYVEESNHQIRSEYYKDIDDTDWNYNGNDTKVIAWYLPQYYRFDINDRFHGKGFTEWTNTSKTIPMFTGHYQPHVPYDVGYYCLNDKEIMHRQIELAKLYGIYGFSFYYYWFSGKRIMEKPLELFLNDPSLDINFCITWANENWSTKWDGGNNDLIFEQRLQESDDYEFINSIEPLLRDSRYIRINGKPVLIIYRINMWEKERVKILLSHFREASDAKGLGELYIMLCNTFGFDEEATEWGADALVEFPPHGLSDYFNVRRIDGYLNHNFIGTIRDLESFLTKKQYLEGHNSKVYYRGAMPSWDNTPRKAYNGAFVYTGLSPVKFGKWLTDIIKESKEIHSRDDDIIFINAWNEWAEGAHLEPDLKNGYAYLNAVKQAIKNGRG